MRPKSLEKEAAIRQTAMRIIAEEGLENLGMQKLATEAGISPRTIYIKYKDKDDLLIKLFIEEGLGNFETAILKNFDTKMGFGEGVRTIWTNAFHYFKNNQPAYALMQYGKSSPMLNKAFKENNIVQGQFFAPIHQFLKHHAQKGTIHDFHLDIHRALLFAPLFDLVNEYFDHKERPKQIITEKTLMACCEAVIKGMRVK